MSDNDFMCAKHNTPKKWIGGEPARTENLYCPTCDIEKEYLDCLIERADENFSDVGKSGALTGGVSDWLKQQKEELG